MSPLRPAVRYTCRLRTGVDAHVSPTFWTRLCSDLATQLRSGRVSEGLVAALREVGETLRRCSPRAPDDRNEPQDDISTSDSG
jgi:putative membrane protein